VTAAFGANIVSTPADNVIAAHAVLDALARHYTACDAAVLAISLDSGLQEARQLFPMPVIGITEAALLTACMLGQRFGMITFGRQTRQMYFDLAADYGMVSRLAECRTIDVSSLGQYLDPNAMANLITTEAKAIAEGTDARSVIICGAAIAGMARRLQPAVPVPLIDGVSCAVRLAEGLARAGYSVRQAYPVGSVPEMVGIGPELAAVFHGNGAGAAK
jgi:allantoin racemase